MNHYYPVMTEDGKLLLRQSMVGSRMRCTTATHLTVTVEIESDDGTKRASTMLLPAEVSNAKLRELLLERIEVAVAMVERQEASR